MHETHIPRPEEADFLRAVLLNRDELLQVIHIQRHPARFILNRGHAFHDSLTLRRQPVARVIRAEQTLQIVSRSAARLATPVADVAGVSRHRRLIPRARARPRVSLARSARHRRPRRARHRVSARRASRVVAAMIPSHRCRHASPFERRDRSRARAGAARARSKRSRVPHRARRAAHRRHRARVAISSFDATIARARRPSRRTARRAVGGDAPPRRRGVVVQARRVERGEKHRLRRARGRFGRGRRAVAGRTHRGRPRRRSHRRRGSAATVDRKG